MTEAEALEAINQRWLDAWPALRPLVPFTFDNELFAAVAAWARVTVVNTVRVQVSAGTEGTRKWEQRGMIMVQLFGAIDAGGGPLATLADDVRAVYEGRRIADEIVTYAGSSRPVPDDGVWAQRTVSIPFVYEQTR